MSDTTIAWTEKSWNPLAAYAKETERRGWACVKASPGCAHCYAEKFNLRLGTGQPYTAAGLAQVTVGLAPTFLDPLRWRKPRKVFVNSMTDLFLPAYSFRHIAAVFGVMLTGPHRHTFQVLTKQTERMTEFFAWLTAPERGREMAAWVGEDAPYARQAVSVFGPALEKIRHIQMGVSIEDQRRADERLPELVKLAPYFETLWISAEPLLEALELRAYLATAGRPGVNWLVIGGESGPQARPMRLEWARALLEQARAAGQPVFFKQTGAGTARELGLPSPAGDIPAEWPADLRCRQYPPGL